MKTLVNQVQLIGNLGKTPELKTLDNGNTMVHFSMATNENYKNNNDEWVSETQWHNVVAWGYLAKKIAKNFDKGSKVIIQGKLTTRSYEQDGVKKYITEVVAQEVLNFKPNNQEDHEEPAKQGSKEGLPF